MQKIFFVKINITLLLGVLAMVVLNLFLLWGGFSKEIKNGAAQKKERLSAQEFVIENPVRGNIKIKNLRITSVDGGFYRKGQKVRFSCDIENDSNSEVQANTSVLRVPSQEIASSNEALPPGQKTILEGALELKETGLLYVACRGDIYQNAKETNESDNQNIAAIYVMD